MQLPVPLQEAIEKEIEFHGLKNLIEAREELTERYRAPAHKKSHMSSEAHRLAYVIARLPATYAAVCNVLMAIKEQAPDVQIKSILDLGAGPGTAAWAAKECFPELETATLIEKDAALMQLGKRLAANHAMHLNWMSGDLEHLTELPAHDLVIFSYSIGELDAQCISKLIDAGWRAADSVFAIIEPGTPVGFERIRTIRSQLIAIGAHLIAPCPHHAACPMAGGDWCHFAARVERSAFHRQLKGGKLGYEDEKFSYVSATKKAYPFPESRVLRHPLHRSGHVVLTLCTEQGVQRPTISKRTPELYKIARKVDWGSTFP